MTPPIARRCAWAGTAPVMVEYHDTEWGFPVDDDRHLFEKMCLEGFQSGLSWSTILNKRPAFRQAFRGFDIEAVARFGSRDVERLLLDAGIVRHRGKIESTINNARRCVSLIDECGSLAAYVWRFEPEPGRRPKNPTAAQVSGFVTSPESVAMSKDLKKRGWSFVGPTTMYAFMQSMGIVDDHHRGCDVRSLVEAARAGFHRPG